MIGKAIKSQPALNASGLIKDNALIVACNNKNITRNKPVTLIITFFPIEDVKMLAITFKI
jgi:hypothetical protein